MSDRIKAWDPRRPKRRKPDERASREYRRFKHVVTPPPIPQPEPDAIDP
jgi:hypothetical protein